MRHLHIIRATGTKQYGMCYMTYSTCIIIVYIVHTYMDSLPASQLFSSLAITLCRFQPINGDQEYITRGGVYNRQYYVYNLQMLK